MVDYVRNKTERVNALLKFSLGMMQGQNPVDLIKKYQPAIDCITPYDMLELEARQLEMQYSPQQIKQYLDKVINVFYRGLAKYQWERPAKGTFLHTLILENEALKQRLEQIKKILLQKDYPETRLELWKTFVELQDFISHYEKKENILFPLFEKKLASYRALQVMWSLHDDIRKKLKTVISKLQDETTEYHIVKVSIGELYFLLYGMMQKENLVLLPVAKDIVSEQEDKEMLKQSFAYSFPFIEAPEQKDFAQTKVDRSFKGKAYFSTETGLLNYEQLLAIFKRLPVDITFVDQDNKVCFYSDSPVRIFPRSPAIIGREVQNCHPPESVHVVESIITAFKKGEKDSATFWLELKGRFILIQYFALRDDEKNYLGVLEVSQDVTDIRKLKGQKRILDWTQ